MKFTNSQIYDMAVKADTLFEDKNKVLPVKIGFYLLKNIKIFKQRAIEIEEMRNNIFSQYIDENGVIPKEKLEEVQEKLTELSEITQELDLYPININDFQDLNFTVEQLELLVDMIQE